MRTFSKLLAATALAGFVAVPVVLPAGKSQVDLLAEGDAAYRAKHYKKAIKAYERASEEGQLPFAAFMGLARSHVALDRHDQARAFAEQALEHAASPDEAGTALNYRGLTFAREARAAAQQRDHEKRRGERHELLQKAIVSYREALETVEDPPPAIWANLADAQCRAHEWQAARLSIEEYLRLEPEGEAAVAATVAHLDCLERAAVALDAEHLLRWEKDSFVGPRKVHTPSPPPVGGGSQYGAAGFDAVIDRDGRLHCAVPLWNNGLSSEFIAGAVRTMSEWRFEPATLDGKPVVVTYTVRITVTKP